MTWFYSKNGRQLGPVTESELLVKFASGELSKTDLVWKEGMHAWMPFEKVEFAGVLPKPSVSGQMEGSVMLPQPPGRSFAQMPQYVPNYLWQSIVVTMFCCMPFGIVAIVYASEVDSHNARGDHAGAQAASNSAKIWIGVSVGAFLLCFAIGIILVLTSI